MGVAGAVANAAVPKAGEVLATTRPFLFSSIRNQIVCIDDLERKGGISVRDVLGLVSFLRENRNCKVVLLLNQAKLDEDEVSKKDFSDYFEKVIDTRLVFSPTPVEAVAIAIVGDDMVPQLIREFAVKLNISNIRVLKKIERLVGMVVPIVDKLRPEVIKQVVHSLVMFGWRKFDVGSNPPPLSYLERSTFDRILKDDGDEISADEARWDTIIEAYDFGHLDELDSSLCRFVETSVLDEESILARAQEVEARVMHMSKANSFESSWRLFHNSFEENDEAVCSSIYRGVKENFAVIGLGNFDGAVGMLRALGHNEMANDLVEFAIKSAGREFWLAVTCSPETPPVLS